MPKVQQVATVSTTEEIVLAPKVRQKLMTELKAYADIKAQIAHLEEKLDKRKEAIDAIRDEEGHQSIQIAGYTVTLVAPTRSKFNEKSFVAAGGDLKLYKNSFDDVPVKAYTRISLPGEKNGKSE